MIPHFSTITKEQAQQIHDQSIRILEEIGVDFTYEPALKVFRDKGLRVEGHRVYFTRAFVEDAVKAAPKEFTLTARNAEHNLVCGGDNVIFMPGYGAPFIYGPDGSKRQSTLEDYDNFVKLAGSSPNMHMTGGNVVEPNDIDEKTRHLDMTYSHIVNSDKCFMGSASGYENAMDSIEMTAILHGGKEQILKNPALICLINSVTPLMYDDRMLGALMAYAETGQAMVIASLVMSGSTGPATLAGVMALQNAEVLAGIALAQSIRPGTPVVYGSTSSIADMRTGSLAIGTPECAILTSASAEMARFYEVPCRGGGGLCDSKLPDAQAGYESMMTLMAAATTRINFVLHTAGILQYYMAMSYEKFIIDDEIAGMVLRYLSGISFSDYKFAFDVIQEVGPGGHFLCEEHTLDNHREEFRLATVSDRASYDAWHAGGLDAAQRATARYQKLLAEYETPALDPAIDKALIDYMAKRREEIHA